MNKKPLDVVGFNTQRGVGKIDIIEHVKPEVKPRKGSYQSTVVKLGFIGADKKPNLSQLGTAVEAIEFALTIDDHYDMREFLDGWMHGDIAEWDEYQSFLLQKPHANKNSG